MCLQAQAGGVQLAQLLAQYRQDHDGGLLLAEQVAQYPGGLVKIPVEHRVGHLEYPGIQLRDGHRVDVLPGNAFLLGVSGDFGDLTHQGVHQVAAQEDQIFGLLGINVPVQRLETAADPVHQIPLALVGKGDAQAVGFDGLGQLGAGVRLVLDQIVDEYQADVLGQLGKQGRPWRPGAPPGP